ncbi:MAG: ABC transporter substrate-binding protein [Clostridiales bacterium]|nr:ABC transporter substrate-binding protein [Clostridiales bacterium]
MKKVLAAALCVILMFTALAGCGSGEGGGGTRLTVYFFGANVPEDAGVVAAANARLAELGLDITLNPIWGDWDAGPRIQTILDTGDSSIDVVFTCSWAVNYTPNALRGNLARLDDPANNLLEQYGQDMVAAVPEFLWNSFKLLKDGEQGIYAVPGYKDFAQMYTWDVNNTRLNELGYDVSDFEWNSETLFDPKLEEAMAAAKELYGDAFFPMLPESTAFARAMANFDADVTGLGVIAFPFDPVDPTQPENIEVGLTIENPDYVRVLEKLHEFYLKGFIDPRVGITAESNATVTGNWNSGNYLFSERTYAYGYDVTASNERGIDAKFMPISSPIVSTIPAQGSGFGISAYSKNKEAAMQFLNAWYTDKELATILAYGVEGDHFVTNEDGTITLDTDRRALFSPWRNGMGNIFILPPQDIEGVNYYEEFKGYNDAGIGTTFLGFYFDTTPVENEAAAIRNVVDEYQTAVSTGVADPATEVPAYIEKLYAAGMQKVLDEVNAQLQAFYATK